MDNQKNTLKELFDKFKNIPFPKVLNTQELQDIKAELVLYDSHVAGLVSSYLKISPIDTDFVKIDARLEQIMQNFQPKTSEEKKCIHDLIEYKHKLDDLIIALLTNIKIRNS